MKYEVENMKHKTTKILNILHQEHIAEHLASLPEEQQLKKDTARSVTWLC